MLTAGVTPVSLLLLLKWTLSTGPKKELMETWGEMSSMNDARAAISAENDLVALTQITVWSEQEERKYMPIETNTCCQKKTKNTVTSTCCCRWRWCGSGGWSSAVRDMRRQWWMLRFLSHLLKHSTMSLTDDAASLPLLISVWSSSLRLGCGKDHTRRLPCLLCSYLVNCCSSRSLPCKH